MDITRRHGGELTDVHWIMCLRVLDNKERWKIKKYKANFHNLIDIILFKYFFLTKWLYVIQCASNDIHTVLMSNIKWCFPEWFSQFSILEFKDILPFLWHQLESCRWKRKTIQYSTRCFFHAARGFCKNSSRLTNTRAFKICTDKEIWTYVCLQLYARTRTWVTHKSHFSSFF